MKECETDYFSLFCDIRKHEFARRYPDLRSSRIDWDVGIQRHDVTALAKSGSCTSLEMSFPDAAPGVCLARYTATNICDSDYESRRQFDSTVGKGGTRRANPVSIFPAPGLLFPSKYADYSSAASRFCITSGRDTLSRAGKTEDGNLLFPLGYDVLFMSGGLILGVFKVAAQRPTPAVRRTLIFV